MAKSVEKPPKFQPLKDNYERFMDVLKRNKDKRLPAVDETLRDRVKKLKDQRFFDEGDESEPPEPEPTLANRDLNSEYYGGVDNVPVRKAIAVKPRKEGVERMQRRMRESLGEKDKTPTITITKEAKEPEKKRSRVIPGFEKAGRPSTIRVGGSKPKSTPEQIESRKKMLRRNTIFGRR
jgi:hypothetical protein